MPSTLFDRIRPHGQPQPHPDAVVVEGQARFTVLSPQLLRMEWDEAGQWEERASYAFPHRHEPPPPFAVRHEGGALLLETAALRLRYQCGAPFSATSLSVVVRAGAGERLWHPGVTAPGNLRGTRRTLDGCAGDAALEPGLLAREGWALFDDSRAVRFGDDGWVEPPRAPPYTDWYLFGYGHEFAALGADYARFGGQVPLVPRFVLGAWWSRYWAYSESELRQLVADFAAHALPLDVFVIDMDWHTPHSWTGYSWNRELFPDPPAFLGWLHEQGLRVTLNLHPHEGVHPHEEAYPAFAAAMGLAAASEAPIPFRMTDRRYVQHYFELLHHPLEAEGVDFWWMDWQQGSTSELAGLDPLPWLNLLHYQDNARRGQRPMLFSRWGGLGNHRYPIGFSGDTFPTWSALAFQPWFTATAANVLFGWWSHDIGGHMGATEPELYARWVQFGALSPCLRLHATKDPLAERRPWAFPPPVFEAARAAFHLRYRLVPYLYTMARRTHDSALALCRPTYYVAPEHEAAYVARHQFLLGDALLAAPIVEAAEAESGLARADLWLPPGRWVDMFTLEAWEGPRWLRLHGDLQRIPLLARAGSIIPLAPLAARTDAIPADELELWVVPGAAGHFRLYEDDGTSEAYRTGEAEWTRFETGMEGAHRCWLRAAPVEGHCPALPPQRRLTVRLLGTARPAEVTVDGAPHTLWDYDADRRITTVPLPLRPKAAPLTLAVRGAAPLVAGDAPAEQGQRHATARRLLGSGWHALGDEALLARLLPRVAEQPRHAEALAALGGPWWRAYDFVTPEEAAQRLGTLVVAAPDDKSPFDVAVRWALHGPDGTTSHQQRVERSRDDLLLPCPAAWDGTIAPLRWQADLEIGWRGQRWRATHHGAALFPTIAAWRFFALPLHEALTDARLLVADPLPWQHDQQGNEALANLNQFHSVPFMREFRPRLRAGERLVGYAAACFHSPEACVAHLHLLAYGELRAFLNGQPVALSDVPPAPLFEAPTTPRQSEAVPLRAGQNELLLINPSPDPYFGNWYLSAALTDGQGQLRAELRATPSAAPRSGRDEEFVGGTGGW